MSHKIESMTVIVVTDENNEEGIPSIGTPMGWMPLVASDHIRLQEIYQAAVTICEAAGKKFKVLKFSTREDVTEQVKEKFKK